MPDRRSRHHHSHRSRHYEDLDRPPSTPPRRRGRSHRRYRSPSSSADRSLDRHRTKRRYPSRTPSPPPQSRRRSRNRSSRKEVFEIKTDGYREKNAQEIDYVPKIFDPSEFEGKTKEEVDMLKTLGFSEFSTSKNKRTEGACNAWGANVQTKRRYRQYMNRRGGFNRPLDPIA
ncbi:hypothetical protein ACOME3_004377 [Neoechinorhynchus agilis]